MINKSLDLLEKDHNEFKNKIDNAETDIEKIEIRKSYIKNLRLYLLEANKIIAETFNVKLNPFETYTGYDVLYKGSADSINKKTSAEFNIEINNLIKSDIYIGLGKDKKQYVDLALFVIKTYYEDNLR